MAKSPPVSSGGELTSQALVNAEVKELVKKLEFIQLI
jgi:hypothetical protein